MSRESTTPFPSLPPVEAVSPHQKLSNRAALSLVAAVSSGGVGGQDRAGMGEGRSCLSRFLMLIVI
jgi:hypothetical protein